MYCLFIQLGPLELKLVFEEKMLFDLAQQGLGQFVVHSPLDPTVLVIHTRDIDEKHYKKSYLLDSPADTLKNRNEEIHFSVPRIFGEYLFRQNNKVPLGLLNILSLCIDHWLPQHTGLNFHAASIEVVGRGFLCFGDPGSGKTTISKLAGGAYSDESSLVYKQDDSWYLAGTPLLSDYTGHLLCGHSPLAACLRLEHSTSNQLSRISSAKAIRALLQQVTQMRREPSHVTLIMNVARKITEEVPVFTLSFANNISAIEYLKRFDQF